MLTNELSIQNIEHGGSAKGGLAMFIKVTDFIFELALDAARDPHLLQAHPRSHHLQCCQLWSELAGLGPNSDFLW